MALLPLSSSLIPKYLFFLDCLRSAIPSTTRVTCLNLGSFLHMVLLNTSSRGTRKFLMAIWLFSAHLSHSVPLETFQKELLSPLSSLLSLSFFSPFLFVNFSSFPTFFCSLCFSHFVLFYFLKKRLTQGYGRTHYVAQASLELTVISLIQLLSAGTASMNLYVFTPFYHSVCTTNTQRHLCV